jgi:hypothetical protein
LAKRAEEEQALARKVDEMMTEWSTLGEELAREEAEAQGARR